MTRRPHGLALVLLGFGSSADAQAVPNPYHSDVPEPPPAIVYRRPAPSPAPAPAPAARPAPAPAPAARPAPAPAPAPVVRAAPAAAPAPVAAAAPVASPEPDTQSDVDAEAEVDADAERDDAETPRLHVHGVGFAYHAIYVRSESGTNYLFSGPGVAYDYYVGRRWGFMMRAVASFPMRGRMSGTNGTFQDSLSDYYETRRYSFDGHFLAARRFALSDAVSLTAGAGVHVQSFEMKGAVYLPIEAITGGVGGLVKFDYDLTSWLSLSAVAASALDFIDFVGHRDRAALTVPMSFSIGLSGRR